MNRKGFIFILIIITIALIGLMVIQSFWIKNAITVKEASFARSVNEAISAVVYKLERIETAQKFKTQMDFMQQRQDWFQYIDSLNQSLLNENGSLEGTWDFDKFLQKSIIAQDVLESMVYDYSNVPVENRVDSLQLDSLISEELKIRQRKRHFQT